MDYRYSYIFSIITYDTIHIGLCTIDRYKEIKI